MVYMGRKLAIHITLHQLNLFKYYVLHGQRLRKRNPSLDRFPALRFLSVHMIVVSSAKRKPFSHLFEKNNFDEELKSIIDTDQEYYGSQHRALTNSMGNLVNHGLFRAHFSTLWTVKETWGGRPISNGSPFLPYWLSFWCRIEWSAAAKALIRSTKTPHVKSFRSILFCIVLTMSRIACWVECFSW